MKVDAIAPHYRVYIARILLRNYYKIDDALSDAVEFELTLSNAKRNV